MKKVKHAYLIMAHHEFNILQKLIDALDDFRNDIYVHIDKKVNSLPVLHCEQARLFTLEERVDVRWGHVSQIAAEYVLFETAHRNIGRYGRYHLISGTHLPLKNQNNIHEFFNRFPNQELLSFLYTDDYEANFKINRFHYFLRNYKSNNPALRTTAQLLWQLLLKIQKWLAIQKSEPKVTTKANNWVSLTEPAVAYVLSKKNHVLTLFNRSFCGDEFFVPYVLGTAEEQFPIRGEETLLFNDFVGSTPRVLTNNDYDFLIASDYLFARKFSSKDIMVVDKIVNHIKADI